MKRVATLVTEAKMLSSGRMFLAVAALATLTTTSHARPGGVSGCFEGVLPETVTDTEVGQASWSTA